MTDLTGRTLGQYEILEEIGRGGMANVYRAIQTSMQREVAIKVLPRHFLQDETFLARFNREVQVISQLEHPAILPVYDFGEVDGLPYIVMRYLTGGTLALLINRNPQGMPFGQIAQVISQVSGALDFAHRRGIIHRDFKPSNVLMDTDGNAYLADFGIAKVSESTLSLTGTGFIGTPGYIAPEMGHEGAVTSSVDTYALGVTLFQMLTGRMPYYADTPMGTLLAHVSSPIPNVLTYRPDAPEGMQAIINGALAKDPANRYPNSGQLAEDLIAVTQATRVHGGDEAGGTQPMVTRKHEQLTGDPNQVPDYLNGQATAPHSTPPSPFTPPAPTSARVAEPVRVRKRRPALVWLFTVLGCIALTAAGLLFFFRSPSTAVLANNLQGTFDVLAGNVEPAATQTPIPTEDAECPYGGTFVADVSYPSGAVVEPGEVFEKAWRIENNGCQDWPGGTQLVFSHGDRMNSPDFVAIPETVVGGRANVSVVLTAPEEPGTYVGYFECVSPAGTSFCEIFVQVVVPRPGDTPVPTETPQPTPTTEPTREPTTTPRPLPTNTPEPVPISPARITAPIVNMSYDGGTWNCSEAEPERCWVSATKDPLGPFSGYSVQFVGPLLHPVPIAHQTTARYFLEYDQPVSIKTVYIEVAGLHEHSVTVYDEAWTRLGGVGPQTLGDVDFTTTIQVNSPAGTAFYIEMVDKSSKWTYIGRIDVTAYAAN
ncbi:MAG: protein kinase [Anaerolineae bacterium]|nr:protein kinase [Anaerolineae bacterium]